MYYILNQIMNPNQIAMIGVLVAFILTFLGLKFPFSFLPVDHGREFAVNGALSKGKTRGVGLTFVCSFIISCVLFMPMDKEYIIYARKETSLDVVVVGPEIKDVTVKDYDDKNTSTDNEDDTVSIEFNPADVN